MIPFFKAGLEDNEYCVWIVSDPMTEEEARVALAEAMPGLDPCEVDLRLEILPAREWYLKDGLFDLKRVASGWDDKLKRALDRGYAGMRVSGNTYWLEKRDWSDFCEYEKQLNESITDKLMTVLCTYPLATSGAAEVLDVARNHHFVMAKRGGDWEVIETSELKQAKEEIKRLNEQLERRVMERTRQLTAVNEELRNEIIERDRTARRRRAEEAELRKHLETLTEREREVMVMVIAGLLNKQIADELGISEKTIKVHRGHVMEKMQAGSLAALVRMAEKLGLSPTQ